MVRENQLSTRDEDRACAAAEAADREVIRARHHAIAENAKDADGAIVTGNGDIADGSNGVGDSQGAEAKIAHTHNVCLLVEHSELAAGQFDAASARGGLADAQFAVDSQLAAMKTNGSRRTAELCAR